MSTKSTLICFWHGFFPLIRRNVIFRDFHGEQSWRFHLIPWRPPRQVQPATGNRQPATGNRSATMLGTGAPVQSSAELPASSRTLRWPSVGSTVQGF
jgi:hypothetical protein